MTEYEEFEQLVRDALANLYDYAALEIHPLATTFHWPPGYEGSRAEYLYHILLEAIEALRPPDRDPSESATEWRPYLILHGRYVEGAELQTLESRLSLSARQLRREHNRAIKAVGTVLWDRAVPAHRETERKQAGISAEQWESTLGAFEVNREPLDLAAVVRGVAGMLQRRVQAVGAELRLDLELELPLVQTDRIVLRQILLSLINDALEVRSKGAIEIGAKVDRDRVILWIQCPTDDSSEIATRERVRVDTLDRWARRLGAALESAPAPEDVAGIRFQLRLPRARESLVLVVDDQDAAIRMFKRYLTRSGLRVVGVQQPDLVLSLAAQLQPRAITLDVMMPVVDGWEILQSLRANPETKDIPVIVCSVWDEPELAASLGASGFLKKPITQKNLWDALSLLGVLDTSDEASARDT
jgi:CheY-like chemotaxis protein